MKKFNKFILNPIFSNDLRYNFYFLNRICGDEQSYENKRKNII